TPGGATVTTAASATTATISGLTNGTSYTFTVHATNAIGNSTDSTPSNPVTPTATTSSISFVQVAGSAFRNNSGGISTTLVPSITDGDFLLSVLGDAKGSRVNWSTPAGWPSTPDVDVASGSISTDMRAVIDHRTAAQDGGATYTWSNSPFTYLSLGVLDYSGVDTANPFDGTATSDTDTTTAPGLTTDVNGCTLVYVLVVSGQANTVTNAPTGFTQRFTISSTGGSTDPHIYVFDATQTTAGATGPISATISGSSSRAVAVVFALRPA
ncbi:MAG: fibronectin type III domain-containing protein, partial [Acidothermaceae bacterium]